MANITVTTGGINIQVTLNDLSISVTTEENNILVQPANVFDSGSTDLSQGTRTGSTVDINSSTGENATLESADTEKAGVMSSAKFNQVVANNSKISFDSIASTKVGHITVTQDVNLDEMESDIATNNEKVGITAGQASAIDANTAKIGITAEQADAIIANTAKVTNATHTGDVTGAEALTIAPNSVTNAKASKMSSRTIKGNQTAGANNPQDLTVDEVNVMNDSGVGLTNIRLNFANDFGTSVYFVAGALGISSLGTMLISGSRLYLVPLMISGEMKIDRLGINVTTGGSATNFRIGIWKADALGQPQTLVYDSGNIAFTGTGVKEIIGQTLVLPAGRYFVGLLPNGTLTCRMVQFSQPIGIDSAIGTAFFRYFFMNFGFGVLTDLTTANLGLITSGFPAIALGIE